MSNYIIKYKICRNYSLGGYKLQWLLIYFICHYIKLCPPYNREGIEFFTNPSYIYYVFNDSSSKQKSCLTCKLRYLYTIKVKGL